MDLKHPMSSIIPGPRGVILELLANTFEPLTGNQIATLSGERVAQSTVSRVLAELVGSGVVTARPAGRAVLHELNREHVGAPAIMAASMLWPTLVERITEDVQTWTIEPVAAWMFGSAARGTGTSDSDIDLVVVRPHDVYAENEIWSAQLNELSRSVRAWTGNECELMEYTLEELSELAEHGDPLISEFRQHAQTLAGKRPSVLLRGLR